MVAALSALFAPRARRSAVRRGMKSVGRAAWIVAPTLALCVAAGCGHRRASMRPVYVDGGTAPAALPGTIETLPQEVPAADSGASSLPPPSVGKSTVSPPNPAGTNEPSLDEKSLEGPEGSSSRVPNLTKPKGPNSRRDTARPAVSASRETTRPVSTGGAARIATLTAQLRPYVDDPAELFQPPKAERPWRYVVLHHSKTAEGSYDEIDRAHRERLGWAGCGYHFVIGNGAGSPDGRIEVARRWSDQKYGVHCRDAKTPEVNEYGIGICLVGDLDKTPPTAKQIAATRALVAYLEAKYAIPVARVETHSHVAASHTDCPGKLFPTHAVLGDRGYAWK